MDIVFYNVKSKEHYCKTLCFQALEYLFKFIVQSRILYSRATCGMEEEQFRTSIQELFQSIRFVLSLDSRSSETLIFTQVRRAPKHSNQYVVLEDEQKK